MIESVLHSIPLFWPGVLCSLVLAVLLRRPVGRLLRAHWAVGFVVLLALGGIVVLTLLPNTNNPYWAAFSHSASVCATTYAGPRPISELFTTTQSSLNVALFIPLGIAGALAGTRVRAAIALFSAAALPFAVEYVQYAVPALGRSCDAQDIWDNLFGLALGAVAGLMSGPPTRAGVRALCTRVNRL